MSKIDFRIDSNGEPESVSLCESGGYGENRPEIQRRSHLEIRLQIQLGDRPRDGPGDGPGDESGIESQGGSQSEFLIAFAAARLEPRPGSWGLAVVTEAGRRDISQRVGCWRLAGGFDAGFRLAGDLRLQRGGRIGGEVGRPMRVSGDGPGTGPVPVGWLWRTAAESVYGVRMSNVRTPDDAR